MFIWDEWPALFRRLETLDAPHEYRARNSCTIRSPSLESLSPFASRAGSTAVRDNGPEHLARCAPGSPLLELARRRLRRDDEHLEQVSLFAWARDHEVRIPELRLLYAIPNFSGRGASLRIRQRDGARLKAEGRKKGMLDICLPVARGGFHGLYIELKVAGGQPSKEQRWWRDALRAENYRAEIVKGWDAARDLIIAYLAVR